MKKISQLFIGIVSFLFFLVSFSNFVFAADSWINTGDLNIGRFRHTATLLNNGKVLVVGGQRSGLDVRQTEIYNPTTGIWSHTNLPHVARELHTANLVTINNSTRATNVLIAGGHVGGTSTNSAELYNPDTSTWILAPSMNFKREAHGSSILNDGRELITGGYNDFISIASTEIYDPIENKWNIKASLNTARRNHSQITFNDVQGNSKVMVIGGRLDAASPLSSTEIYDPLSDTWVAGPAMNLPRTSFSTVVLHDGRILVVGGDAPNFNTSEVYNPNDNSWIVYPTSSIFRNTGAITLLGSEGDYKVLAAGGGSTTATNAQLFDPSLNQWSTTTSMNTARGLFTLTTLNDGTVLAASGLASGGQTRTSEIYTPSAIDPTITPTPTPTKTPLILIPGMAGSELKTNQTFTSEIKDCGILPPFTYTINDIVWLDIIKAGTSPCDDYFDVLKLDLDGQTLQFPQIVLNGTFVSLAYGDFVDFFESIGYELNENLFLFPYDWRKDVSLTASLLDQKINSILEQPGAEKVDLVAHSMGGLVARNYIRDTENAQKVRKLFTLGTPHLGATEFIKNLMYGGCLSTDPFKNPICFGVSASEVKDVVQNMISGFELSPSQTYFDFYFGSDNLHPFPLADVRDIDADGVTGKLNYSQIKTLLTSLDYNTSLFDPSETFHSLDNNLINTSGVEVSIIAGSGIATLGQIIEKYKVNFAGVKIPKRDEIAINGDQTVPLFSASLSDPSNSQSLVGPAALYYTNQKHGALVENGPALELVKNILNEEPTLPDGVSLEPFKLNGYQLSVHSPVELHVYDQLGNHTGPTIDGDAEANIPGSSYDTLDDAKFIWLPDDGIYNIEFEATDEGSFDFKIRKFEEDLDSQTFFYKDVPLTVSTKASAIFDTQSPQPPILNLDTNGDGSEDFQVDHFSILEGDANYDSTPPNISVDVSPKTIWPPNGRMVDVNLTGSITDEIPYETKILVDDEYDLLEPFIFTDQAQINQTVQLKAFRREDDKDGRKYTIKVLSTDLAGNSSFESFEVIVPHDQRD